jgi:hypothetical protein
VSLRDDLATARQCLRGARAEQQRLRVLLDRVRTMTLGFGLPHSGALNTRRTAIVNLIDNEAGICRSPNGRLDGHNEFIQAVEGSLTEFVCAFCGKP